MLNHSRIPNNMAARKPIPFDCVELLFLKIVSGKIVFSKYTYGPANKSKVKRSKRNCLPATQPRFKVFMLAVAGEGTILNKSFSEFRI